MVLMSPPYQAGTEQATHYLIQCRPSCTMPYVSVLLNPSYDYVFFFLMTVQLNTRLVTTVPAVAPHLNCVKLSTSIASEVNHWINFTKSLSPPGGTHLNFRPELFRDMAFWTKCWRVCYILGHHPSPKTFGHTDVNEIHESNKYMIQGPMFML